MSLKSIIPSAVAGAVLAVAALNYPVHATTLSDNTVLSFETPSVGADGYQYNPSSPYNPGTFSNPTEGVTFSGTSGIQANGSAWGLTNAPLGTQTAFLQAYGSNSPGQISFTYATTMGQTYALTFYVEGRPNVGGYTYGGNAFTVDVSGISQPFNFASPSTTSWTEEVVDFTATSTTTAFSIAIDACTSCDLAIGVDDVDPGAVPLPPTWTMLIAGFLGLGSFAYRGSKKKAAAIAVA